MNKNFTIYDTYTVRFQSEKEREIIHQYYCIEEQNKLVRVICDQTFNGGLYGEPEAICDLHAMNAKYKTNNLLTNQSDNEHFYFQIHDVIPLVPSKYYTFRLVDEDNNATYISSGVNVTITFCE